MPEISIGLNCADLAAFFTEFANVTKIEPSTPNFAERLAQFFIELPLIASDQAVPDFVSPSHSDLLRFFEAVQIPLEVLIASGGMLNLWAIAGLKHNEVRTAGALAGLWQTDFGGATSRDFLAFYLKLAVKHVEWERELRTGYRVFTEVNPMGDLADRVDLVVETEQYLIGMEIKIKAGLGPMQLDRYSSALTARAEHMHKSPLLILLAPFAVTNLKAHSSTWSDVSAAARWAAKHGAGVKTLIHHAIAQFGDHVAQH